MLVRVVDNDNFRYIIRSVRGVDFFSAQHLFSNFIFWMIAPFLKNDEFSIIMLVRVA